MEKDKIKTEDYHYSVGVGFSKYVNQQFSDPFNKQINGIDLNNHKQIDAEILKQIDYLLAIFSPLHKDYTDKLSIAINSIKI